MPRMTKAVGFVFAFVLLLSIQPAYADERSYRISEVDIHAVVNSKGDMRVTEAYKYQFDGAFNGIVVELDSLKSDGIEDFQAFEVSEGREIPLRTELSSDGSQLEYKAFSPSKDESKAFRLTYTVKNVVQVYADTAELYWKFFDGRNQSALETVNIDVELPNGAVREEITAFGHGPPHGDFQIEGNGVIRYRISPLPSEEMLEVRVLFPGSYVPESTRVSDERMLEAITREEEIWGNEGDDRSVFGALALLLVNLAGGIYLKFGDRFKFGWKEKYYRELPGDITPAVVGYLEKYEVKPQDLMATLVDLVRKKRVHMEMVKGSGRKQTNYTFQLLEREQKEEELQPHETMLINWFFQKIMKSDKISLSDIRKYAKEEPGDFREHWSKWQEEVAQSAVRTGYIVSHKLARRTVQLASVIQFFGLLFLATDAWRWLMFCAIPLIFLIPKRMRKTKMGRVEYGKWQAFKRFLQDYSQFETCEPMAVHLWEHYFVYAIPLGVAKKVIAIARLSVPAAQKNNFTVDNSYFYHYELWTDSFEQSIRETTPSSSSSESGDSDGSFSSGGGGGGGGGGRGAF